jgi:hypothetical protein
LTDLDTVVFDIQSFVLNWSIDRGNVGASCGEVGGVTVELITRLGEDEPRRLSFPCTAPNHSAASGAIPTGSYSVQVRLLDVAGKELSSIKPMTFVVGGTRRAVLPPITFVVN